MPPIDTNPIHQTKFDHAGYIQFDEHSPPHSLKTSPDRFSMATRYDLENTEKKYDQFISQISKKYGLASTRIVISGEPAGAFGMVGTKPVEVAYIRKMERLSTAEDKAIQSVIKEVIAPSIVHVAGWGKDGGWSGSGAIIDLKEALGEEFPVQYDKNGNPVYTYGVITNNHVVPAGDTKYIAVTLASGEVIRNIKIDGEVIRCAEVLKSKVADASVQDKTVDAAIIVIRSKVPLPTLHIAKEAPEIGDAVVAAGHPLSLPKATFTFGRVSRHGQETGAGIFTTQHDADINPGNSGGPALNSRGEIIGLNTFTFRGSTGLSFAMPIQKQLEVLKKIYKKGEFIRGDFGFSVASLNNYERYTSGFNGPGAKVSQVDYGSDAYNMGLRANCIITRIYNDNGDELDINIDNYFETTRFLEWMHRQKPGSYVHIDYISPKKEGSLTTYPPENMNSISIKVGRLKDNRTALKSDTLGLLPKKDNFKKGIETYLLAA